MTKQKYYPDMNVMKSLHKRVIGCASAYSHYKAPLWEKGHQLVHSVGLEGHSAGSPARGKTSQGFKKICKQFTFALCWQSDAISVQFVCFQIYS